MICLSPLLLLLAVWIKCDSPGPIFYRQWRVGRHNRDFLLYKFRSMREYADQSGLVTIGDHDARVTRSGYYIRKYKLDELPQLMNVLKGDMSLVGPRPEVRKYVDLYTPEQLGVLEVRPGITSPASIRYRHEDELLATAEDPQAYYITQVMPAKLALDLEYVHKVSVWTDIKLVLTTLKVIVFE